MGCIVASRSAAVAVAAVDVIAGIVAALLLVVDTDDVLIEEVDGPLIAKASNAATQWVKFLVEVVEDVIDASVAAVVVVVAASSSEVNSLNASSQLSMFMLKGCCVVEEVVVVDSATATTLCLLRVMSCDGRRLGDTVGGGSIIGAL